MNKFQELNSIEKLVYKSLLVSPKLKKDLMKDLKLPKTTANRILQSLISKNFIEESGVKSSTGGRPPIIYAPAKNNFFIIGIDISRSYSEVIVMNSALDIVFKNRFIMNSNFNPENTVINISNIVTNAISDLSINKENIIGIGLGVVEPINPKTGMLGHITNSLNDEWNHLNIKELFGQYFDLPIFLERGANMAAVGEFFINLDKNINKIIYLNLGLGIRYGLVNNGEIINSYDPVYDALGHMIINFDGKKCQCGKNGCLELYGTISAIEDSFDTNSIENNISIDYILAQAQLGNLKAQESIDKALYSLAIGINNFSNILNPDKFIINGPLIQKNSYIFKQLITYIKSFNNDTEKIDLIYSSTSSFGESIISMGAALTFLLNSIK